VTVRNIVLPDFCIKPRVRAELHPVMAVGGTGEIVGVLVAVGGNVAVEVFDGV